MFSSDTSVQFGSGSELIKKYNIFPPLKFDLKIFKKLNQMGCQSCGLSWKIRKIALSHRFFHVTGYPAEPSARIDMNPRIHWNGNWDIRQITATVSHNRITGYPGELQFSGAWVLTLGKGGELKPDIRMSTNVGGARTAVNPRTR